MFVIPAQAGIQQEHWMPAFAGMTSIKTESLY